MEQRQCEFGLHAGPFFPEAVAKINDHYRYTCISDDVLGLLARDPQNNVRNFDYVEFLPTATDNTQWYAGMQFTFGKDRGVFVVFPFHNEENVSVAVYTRGADQREIDMVMDDILNILMLQSHAD